MITKTPWGCNNRHISCMYANAALVPTPVTSAEPSFPLLSSSATPPLVIASRVPLSTTADHLLVDNALYPLF